jgi:hypothetical protein|mmetsp:Transcript_15015/g.19731  ORF Transcript_15015/g.19731 Transcript_15015/m.19731 type:complete len:224 (-) Transcript_15015:355-1026(-)|eukprot:CAMPEP_0195248540 /NCGR_PEP_ID=MMETSP0706-20130129/1600_1 /TAXON_ID=33640 /ORGANISM="Asterionellopsis glacialis, Strain CCMP134" /LENGTH=223 /DNA_ID=CAMNT_0040300209 /DNA_START=162 /DNA_END=833 /DNA_ORIENTATION=-
MTAGMRSPLRSPKRSGDYNKNNNQRYRSSDSTSPPANRARLNSREIPRTYSGLYGQGGEGGDLMPFELSRNRNTDWLKAGGPILLGTYVSIICVFHAIFMAICSFPMSWTVTHTAHFLVTLVYLHWIKGSPNFYEQGEMNAMTTWEQIDSTVGLSNERRALLVVPTILCYAACHFAKYDAQLVTINVLIWAVEIVAKLPFMNGVRLLGINRTTGIDDDVRKDN